MSLWFSCRVPQPHELCFLPLPVLVIDPDYALAIPFEDLQILKLGTNRQPEIGTEILPLALISICDGKPASANLLSPIVINLRNRLAVQSMQSRFFRKELRLTKKEN